VPFSDVVVLRTRVRGTDSSIEVVRVLVPVEVVVVARARVRGAGFSGAASALLALLARVVLVVLVVLRARVLVSLALFVLVDFARVRGFVSLVFSSPLFDALRLSRSSSDLLDFGVILPHL